MVPYLDAIVGSTKHLHDTLKFAKKVGTYSTRDQAQAQKLLKSLETITAEVRGHLKKLGSRSLKTRILKHTYLEV